MEVPTLWPSRDRTTSWHGCEQGSGGRLGEGFPGRPRQESERTPGLASVEGDEVASAGSNQARVGRQTRQIHDLDLHAYEGHPGDVVDGGPLAERLQQCAENDGRPFVFPGQTEEPVDAVAKLAVRRWWNIDQRVHEGEHSGDAGEAIPHPGDPGEGPREGRDVGMASEGESKIPERLARGLRG